MEIFKQFGACRKMESTENVLGINVDEHVITDEQGIADHFNEFFVNVAVKTETATDALIF